MTKPKASPKEKTTKTVFMIQRNSDGLFSTGGMAPKFSSRGKAWSNFGALKNHLHQFHNYKGQPINFPYKDCTIVALEKVMVVHKKPDLEDWSVETLFDEIRQPASNVSQ